MKLRTIRAGRAQSLRSGKNHRVSIETLETRIAPASGLDAIFSTGALMIVDSSGAASDANLTISLNGANIRITDPSQSLTAVGGGTQIDINTVEFPFSSITSIFEVDAGSGDDSLLIDYSGGNPIPSTGFNFDGGIGADTLVANGGTAGIINHAPITFDSGGFIVDGTPVIYDGLEDFTESLDSAFRIFGFDATADVVTITTGPGPLMTLSSTISLATKFASPSATLFLNTGDGDDTINVTSINPNFTGALFIDADTGIDTLNIGAAVTGSSIDATAETINIESKLKPGAGGAIFRGSTVGFQSPAGLTFNIAGSGANPSFGGVQVFGTLDLTGAELDIQSSLTSLPTAPLILVSNDGSDPISDAFTGLPEGTSLTINGANFLLTYFGGDGNDVAITPVAPVLPGVINLGALNGSDGLILFGQNNGDHLGRSVSGAGDLDNDGVDDFIVSAVGFDQSGAPDAGAAYVVFGTDGGIPSPLNLATLNGSNGFKIEGVSSTQEVGLSVSKAGDVNGDGIDDILVSSTESSQSGATYVIFGRTGNFPSTVGVISLNGTNGFKMTGLSSSDQSLHISSAAGDINGDGAPDILIGIAAGINDGAASSGTAYVVFGRTSTPFSSIVNISALNGTDGFKINGELTGNKFGSSVSSAGDINGDGIDDIIIGAPNAQNAGSTVGCAYVIFGKKTPFPVALDAGTLDGKKGFRMFGQNGADYLGASVSSAGDVNGDGFADIIVGAPQSNPDQAGPGIGYVVFGKRSAFPATLDLSTLNGANGFALQGEISGDFAAKSVSSAGDFNDDGYGDFIIGAERSGGGGTGYLVFGRPAGFPPSLTLSTLNGTTGYKFVGSVPGGGAGASVNGAGDVNGDGKDDIIIGAPFGVGQFPGAGNAYVVFGNGAMHQLPVIKSGGKTATFLDTDGEVVSVTVSKGKITQDMLTFGPGGGLFLVDLTAGNTFQQGANITFAVKKIAGQDGVIHVGAITGNGLSLGKVKVTGDLGQIDVGNGNVLKPALKSLTVGSLGVMGADMQLPGTFNPLTSDISGGLPKFTILGNLNLASINVLGALGNITIGGEFLGTGALSLSQLQGLAALGHGVIAPVAGGTTLASSGLNAGSIGSINIKQSLNNAAINSSGNIGSASIGGMDKGAIVAAGSLRVVKVTGAITSDDPNIPSVIAALAAVPNSKPSSAIAINAFTVKGSVLNAEILVGYNRDFVPTNSDASIGTFTVKGSWTASSVAVGVADFAADGFGRNDVPIFAGVDGTGTDLTPNIISRIASLIIGNVALRADGSANAGDFFGITAQLIGKAKINGLKIVLDKLVKDDIELGTTGDFRLVEV